MITPAETQPQTQLSTQTQPAPPPAPPSRRRKTHKDAEYAALLRDLPRAKRLDRNREIKTRNEQRAISRAYRNQNPGEDIEGGRYSSDESLLTLSEGEDDAPPSASQQACNFLSSMSPGTASSWFKKALPKRARSINDTQEEEASSNMSTALQRAKRTHAARRPEAKIEDGELPNPGFSTYHFDLYSTETYMPLSLFTNTNLRIISREGGSLPFKKTMATDRSGKTVKIIDTFQFEKLYGSEKELTHAKWTQAAGNYMRFCQEVGGTTWHQRWFDHFYYLDGREDAEENFEAIKCVDIQIRKDYSSNPFEFNKIYAHMQVEKAIREIEMKQIKGHPSSSIPQSSRFSRPKPFPGQSSTSRPFQNRTGGDPSSAACVICAKKGHVFSTCQSSSFDDGKALFCKAEDGNLTSIRSKSSICRSWNIRGSNSTACGNHAQDKRVHICSFCGDKSHHAFSWTCRRDPSKSSPQN